MANLNLPAPKAVGVARTISSALLLQGEISGIKRKSGRRKGTEVKKIMAHADIREIEHPKKPSLLLPSRGSAHTLNGKAVWHSLDTVLETLEEGNKRGA